MCKEINEKNWNLNCCWKSETRNGANRVTHSCNKIYYYQLIYVKFSYESVWCWWLWQCEVAYCACARATEEKNTYKPPIYFCEWEVNTCMAGCCKAHAIVDNNKRHTEWFSLSIYPFTVCIDVQFSKTVCQHYGRHSDLFFFVVVVAVVFLNLHLVQRQKE